MNRITDGESAQDGLNLVADLDASASEANNISRQVLQLAIEYAAKIDGLSTEEATSAGSRLATSVAANAATFNDASVSQSARDSAKSYLGVLTNAIN